MHLEAMWRIFLSERRALGQRFHAARLPIEVLTPPPLRLILTPGISWNAGLPVRMIAVEAICGVGTTSAMRVPGSLTSILIICIDRT